jgi:predicted dehydrogenase
VSDTTGEAAPVATEPSPIRWAVLGTGRISEAFVPDLLAVQPGSVTSIWGRRPETVEDFGQRHGIPHRTANIGNVLQRDDVDAVYIATPVATHTDLALRALDAGKHVLVEKPMAYTAGDVEKIFERAAANDRFVMEAMWMKFNPLHVEIRKRIWEGLIGDARFVRAAFGMPFPAGGTRWNADLGASTVLDQGIYTITLAEWVLGPVKRATAIGQVLDGVDVSAQMTLEHHSGGISQLACSITEFVDPSASLSGTAGWIEIPAMFWATSSARLHAGSTNALFHSPDVISYSREGNGYMPMIRSVTAAIQTGARQHAQHDEAATLSVARIMDDVRAQIYAQAGSSVLSVETVGK